MHSAPWKQYKKKKRSHQATARNMLPCCKATCLAFVRQLCVCVWGGGTESMGRACRDRTMYASTSGRSSAEGANAGWMMRAATLQAPSDSIVSLLPGATEILFALGLGHRYTHAFARSGLLQHTRLIVGAKSGGPAGQQEGGERGMV